jgi:hypothetical protein
VLLLTFRAGIPAKMVVVIWHVASRQDIFNAKCSFEQSIDDKVEQEANTRRTNYLMPPFNCTFSV